MSQSQHYSAPSSAPSSSLPNNDEYARVSSDIKKNYTTLLLSITVFFLFADQNLLSPNLSAIAKEFHFSDAERDAYLGGYIAFGFFIVGAPVALLVGYLADKVPAKRCKLLGFVVLCGACASLATYWVRDYGQLFVCRVFTGISIGGATPVIFSLLGDLYPGSSRIYVSTMIGVALGGGVAGGQLISGMVGPSMGWRTPFLIIAIPAIMCAVLVVSTVDEPRRGDQEQAVRQHRARQNSNNAPLMCQTQCESQDDVVYSETIECSKVLKMLQTPTVLIIFIQGFPGCLPWGMIIVFLNDYLSNERNLSVEAATAVLTCFGVGGLFGQLIGGWLGQKLYNHNPRWQCAFMGITTILSVPPMLYILNSTVVGDPEFFMMAFAGGFIVNMNGPNVRVVLQNSCTPEIRGTAFAFFTLTDDIGKGLGPALVVLLIQGCDGKRKEAFNIIVLFWVLCGCLLLALTITVTTDEQRVQQQIQDSLLNRTTRAHEGGSYYDQNCPSPKTPYAVLVNDVAPQGKYITKSGSNDITANPLQLNSETVTG